MFIRKIQKISITIFSLLLLSAMATGTVSAKTNTKTINYVALGDSLAKGQIPTELGELGGYDTSYADIISDKLGGKGDVNYNNYSMSGYTIPTVFATANPAEIQKADVITLNIGANDLLNFVNMNDTQLSNLSEVDLAAWLDVMLSMDVDIDGDVDQDDIHSQLQDIQAVIPNIALGVAATVSTIHDIDMSDGTQDAQIYVMGYYNAFSFLTDLGVSTANKEKIPLLQAELDGLVQIYNSSLSGLLMDMPGVTYVNTYDSMDKHLENYLPIDIHPTVQGYRAIAKAFLDAMEPVLVSE